MVENKLSDTLTVLFPTSTGKGAMLTYLVVDHRTEEELPEICRVGHDRTLGATVQAPGDAAAHDPQVGGAPFQGIGGNNMIDGQQAGQEGPQGASIVEEDGAATSPASSSSDAEKHAANGRTPLLSQSTSNSLQQHFTRVESLEKEALQRMLDDEHPSGVGSSKNSS